MDLDKIGKFIKYLRVKKVLSQEELASKINVTNKAISRWECGNGLPGTSILEPLSSTTTSLLSIICFAVLLIISSGTKPNVSYKDFMSS